MQASRRAPGAGEADVPSHLAMARYLAHAGKNEQAMAILDAVTVLSPISCDAWAQRAVMARGVGNEPLAADSGAPAASVA